MLHNFLIVLQQVIVLFILILIGYFCGKRRIFSAETIRGLDFLVLNMALPCTIVRGFKLVPVLHCPRIRREQCPFR